MPVYFVLGNHNYYRGSIAGVRQTARILSRQSSDLAWLPERGVVHLDARTALIGHGGWGDGRAGHFLASDVVLNDYLLIEELKPAQGIPPGQPVLTPALLEKLHALGDEAAAHIRRVLREALQDHERVILLTHVPPLRQACWHEGQLSDNNWAPHFVCQAVGLVLVEFMTQHPAKQMTVLCGHSEIAAFPLQKITEEWPDYYNSPLNLQ